ncbi:MAG: hypothetical protein ACI4Q6_03385 [Huintestinicola sp.]
MSYCDYAFYRDKYHGKMSEADFLRNAESASAFVDMVTFDRITDEVLSDEKIADKVKRSVCAAADKMNEVCHGDVIQETVGSTSRTYAQKSESKKNGALYSAVKLFLGNVYFKGTKLMYRGG